MIGHRVNLDAGLIKFFYPEFSISTFVTPADKHSDIIVSAKFSQGASVSIPKNTNRFIWSCSNAEQGYDFSNKENLLKWVVKTLGLKEPNYELISTLYPDDTTYLNMIKEVWVLKKLPKKVSNSTVTPFNLYKAVSEGMVADSLKVLYDIPINPKLIELSLVEFLTKSANPDKYSTSPTYKKILLQMNRSFGKKIPKVLVEESRTTYSSEISLIRLITLLL